MNTATINTDVLVVGGGTGATAAAIQSARRGAKTMLVSELPWLGGMLTAAGVAAPDGNELLALQTGIWGEFLKELRRRQPGGLDNAWVSCFTYEPKIGAAIFASWVDALPNLRWIVGQAPRAVLRAGDRILGVRFDDLTIRAQVTLDGTELGDLLALGHVSYRWGWEDQAQFGEPSAPQSLTDPTDALHEIIQTYPVQSPTWVVLLQDVGEGNEASPIAPTDSYDPSQFQGAWDGYGAEAFLNYGRLPQNQFMLNWPNRGNDYGRDLHRLIQGDAAWQAWADEAIAHSQNFAHFIQSRLGRRYGLAAEAFPTIPGRPGGGAFALMPYYRESRRLVGLATVTELDILPQAGGRAAPLPINDQGDMSAIAIGNYPNDHHYPGFDLPLVPKSMHWGGRWTGTPFTIPYEVLVPAAVDGLLACDKNISVSHIANGATRLQPIVLGIGQAAGMAAALCVEQGCEPRQLSVTTLQAALLQEPTAPAAIVPLLDNLPGEREWRSRQTHYQTHPKVFPNGKEIGAVFSKNDICQLQTNFKVVELQGILIYTQTCETWEAFLQIAAGHSLKLITLHPAIQATLERLKASQQAVCRGYLNWAAGWFLVIEITLTPKDLEKIRR